MAGLLMRAAGGADNAAWKPQRWAAWCSAAAAVLAATAYFLVSHGGAAQLAHAPIQQALFLAANRCASALDPAVWATITLLGDTSVIVPMLALLLWRRPQAVAALLASIPIGGLVSITIKQITVAPRPAAVLDHAQFTLIGEALRANSFPSGHAITAFAVAAAMLAVFMPLQPRRRDWLLASVSVLAALTVALSRIAVGAHWPLDLLAGASLGWLCGLAGAAVARRWQGWWRWLLEGRGQSAAGLAALAWGGVVLERAHHTDSASFMLWWAGLSAVVLGLGALALALRAAASATSWSVPRA